MGKLVNDKQERFAQLIAVNVPAAQAYADAGYDNPGFAAENARKLRNKKKVAARIAELTASTADLVELRRLLLDKFYVAAIMIDRLRMFDCGVLRDDLSDEERMLIEGREETKFGTKYLMPKKLEAAEKLARLHGLDRPTKIAATDAEGNDAPITDEQRVMALAAIFARVQAENAAAEASQAGEASEPASGA
jgi:hypothetical protein